MTKCTNETLRELVPLLAQETLGAADAARVRAHVADCTACREELAAVQAARQLFAAATPRVDEAAILSRLPLPPSARPALRLEPRVAKRPHWRMQPLLAAAASLVLVTALSLTALKSSFFGPTPSVAPEMVASTSTAVLGGTQLGELETDELEALLSELNALDALVSEEPATYRQPLLSDVEGP